MQFVCFADLNEIHARLLDHRPILQGHVNFFVREFEVHVASSHFVFNIATLLLILKKISHKNANKDTLFDFSVYIFFYLKGKRNDHELERLKKSKDNIEDLNDNLLPQATNGMDFYLANITAKCNTNS